MSESYRVTDIYLEEKFQLSESSGVDGLFLETHLYQDPEELDEKFSKFYALPESESIALVKHFREIHNSIGLDDFERFVEKAFDFEKARSALPKSQDLILALLDALQGVYSLLNIDQSAPNSSRNDSSVDYLTRMRVSSFFSSSKGKLTNSFLQFLRICLLSDSELVRQTAKRSLKGIAIFMLPFECDHKLLPSILELTQEKEASKVLTGLDLLGSFGHLFSTKFVEAYAFAEVSRLQGSKVEAVRRQAYRAFFGLLEHLSAEFIEQKARNKLAAAFKHSDQEVRVLVIQNIDSIVKTFPAEHTTGLLLEQFLEFANSKTRPLKVEALKFTGRFLLAFLAKESRAVILSSLPDLNRLFKIYFNLPGLVTALEPKQRIEVIEQNFELVYAIFVKFGPDLWPYFRYFILKLDESKDSDLVERTKMILASKLTLIAGILNSETISSQFLPLLCSRFLSLSKATSLKVKVTSVKVLSSILKLISPSDRKKFCDFYISSLSDCREWRFEFSLAGQLETLLEIFETEEIVSFIVPMFFKLCKAEAAIVRKFAAEHFYLLAKKVAADRKESLPFVMEYVRFFAQSSSHLHRLTFLKLFGSLASSAPDLIDDFLLSEFRKVAGAKTPGIRFAAAVIAAGPHSSPQLQQVCQEIKELILQSGPPEAKKVFEDALPPKESDPE